MNRTALVTGVTGFIGGKLAQRILEQGWRVHAVLRESSDTSDIPAQVEIHRHDGTVGGLTQIVRSTAPDVVFHLASLYLTDHLPDQVDALIASNILFPAQLAEAMTAAGALRLVNTGTAWQHFGTADYNPVNLYAATKQACVDVLRYYHDAQKLSMVTLKLFDTYGAGDTRRKLVQLLVDAARSGEPLDMSPGEQTLDLTHVDDVVDAFLAAATLLLQAGAALNEDYLVSGERLTVRELVATVSEAMGRDIRVNIGGRPYRPREVMMPVGASGGSALPDWAPVRDIRSTLTAVTDRNGGGGRR